MKKENSIIVTKDLIELKYKILMQRINKTYNLLKVLSVAIDCDNDIKDIEIIQEQYERMYHQLLKTKEYQKYKEIENIIIKSLSKIELKIDETIHSTLKDYENIFQGIFQSIRESKNYNEYHNLDTEIEKIKWIKELAKQYESFMNEEERNKLKTTISKFKFELLIRRQLEQMVYENGGTSSNLKRFDSEEEQRLFEECLNQLMLELDEEDEIKQECNASQIMDDNILLNHVVFKIAEKKIKENAGQFKQLLNAQVFNPHLSNIGNNPYTEQIDFASASISIYDIYDYDKFDYWGKRYLKRNRINFSLLIAVIKQAISEKNTTITECARIYAKFGFQCRPIVINEGQELIRQIFNKIGFISPLPEKTATVKKGKWAAFRVTSFNYIFKPKEERFLTNAEIVQYLKKEKPEKAMNYFEAIYELMGKQNLTLREQEEILFRRNLEIDKITGYENVWVRESLNSFLGIKGNVRLTPVPQYERCISSKHTFNKGTEYKYVHVADEEPLWKSYESDLDRLKVNARRWENNICLYLDDMSDLPIDYDKIKILTEEQEKRMMEIGNNEGR